MLQVSSMLFAQEFSTKLYLEAANGEKDILEIGYDPNATFFPSASFGEILYDSPLWPLLSFTEPPKLKEDKFQVFFTDPWFWFMTDPCEKYGENGKVDFVPCESAYYTKKRVIKKNSDDICCIITGIVIPTSSLPVTISWDDVQSESAEIEHCFFIDRHFSSLSFNYERLVFWDRNAWSYAQRKDANQKGSVQYTSIDSNYSFFGLRTPLSVLYFGFINLDTYLDMDKIRVNAEISISPSLVIDFCEIKSSSGKNIKRVKIFSVSGEEITLFYDKETSILDCTPLTKGIYVVVIETTDDKKEYCKLIKR